MKLTLTIFLATILSLLAQAPPIQRNSFTTNTEVMALEKVTNVVVVFVTNKVDSLNGKSTNLFATNFTAAGDMTWSNVDNLTRHAVANDGSIQNKYNFNTNGGSTYTWQQTFTSNYFRVNTRVGVSAVNLFYLFRDGFASFGQAGKTATNLWNVRHEGDVYLPAPAGTATNLTLDPNGKIVAVTNGAGGGSQTPWTANVNAAGYALSNVTQVSTTNFTSKGGRVIIDEKSGTTPVFAVNTNVLLVDGNLVGIRTPSPTATLHVNGDVKIENGIVVTQSVGTSWFQSPVRFSASVSNAVARSNFVMNVQSGKVYADFACVEGFVRTVWITNSLITANSIVIMSHSGTNAISGGLLPPLSCTPVTGILKLHMSQSSWNTADNKASISWFVTNPGE